MRQLDAAVSQKVSYCIPDWLKNEQVKASIARVSGRVEPHSRREEPIALVSFGPSLNDTWEELKKFKYIMTCSGAHKFLVDRGIIPTYHCDVDPRPHKVTLIGTPQEETEYLIASACHPKMFDHLEGYNVKLWHVFDTTEEGDRLLPRGEWALTGGCSIGLRTLTLAAFLGFRDLHIFGMDGCSGKTGQHAAEHPNQPKNLDTCVYNGVEYTTTPAMLESARQTWHELNQMPVVKATFYGEGLVQAMAKDYKRPQTAEKEGFTNLIGYNKPELISEEYAELNRRLHRDSLHYGVGGGKHAATVIQLRDRIKAVSILDYGCGKGMLAKALPFPIWEYDPGVPGKEDVPRPAELVICTDVLEHIEPDKILFVLSDLKRVTLKLGYFVVHTGPSSKTLADGRNAHLLQHDKEWWRKKLKKFFEVGKIKEVGPILHIVVAPKKKA